VEITGSSPFCVGDSHRGLCPLSPPDGFASASASACVCVDRTGSQVSFVEALDWDPLFVVVTLTHALALALAKPFWRWSEPSIPGILIHSKRRGTR
jgi:hypothetical protein